MNTLLPVVLAGGATLLNDKVTRGAVRVNVWAGVFVYGMFVFVLEGINAQLAFALAWVVAATSLLLIGVPVFQGLTKGVS